MGQHQHQHQQKQKQEELTRQCYRNFVESIKTAKTRKNYIQSLQYYMKYLGLGKDDYGSLLLDDHKLIQSNIIDFIIWCRDTKQLSPSTISEAHGGKIWAENISDGSGATFSFSLPIRDK